jgi:hypothetical protein
MPKTDVELEKDPYLRLGMLILNLNYILGFGMNAYFDTLKYMMVLMFLIFTFNFPAMHIYSSFDSLKHEAMYMFTQYSLGNLGNHFKISNLQ